VKPSTKFSKLSLRGTLELIREAIEIATSFISIFPFNQAYPIRASAASLNPYLSCLDGRRERNPDAFSAVASIDPGSFVFFTSPVAVNSAKLYIKLETPSPILAYCLFSKILLKDCSLVYPPVEDLTLLNSLKNKSLILVRVSLSRLIASLNASSGGTPWFVVM